MSVSSVERVGESEAAPVAGLRGGSGVMAGVGVGPAALALCTNAVALACACKTRAVASALWMMAVASAAALSLGLGADPPAGAAGEQPTSQADTKAKTRGEINL